MTTRRPLTIFVDVEVDLKFPPPEAPPKELENEDALFILQRTKHGHKQTQIHENTQLNETSKLQEASTFITSVSLQQNISMINFSGDCYASN